MLGALLTGEAWLCRFSTLRGNNTTPPTMLDKILFVVLSLPVCGLETHPLFGGGETGDSEGQGLLGGGSSSSSSSEELSSVRSITSTFLLLSLDDPRFCSWASVRDESTKRNS